MIDEELAKKIHKALVDELNTMTFEELRDFVYESDELEE